MVIAFDCSLSIIKELLKFEFKYYKNCPSHSVFATGDIDFVSIYKPSLKKVIISLSFLGDTLNVTVKLTRRNNDE